MLFFCDDDTDTLVLASIERKGGNVNASDVGGQRPKRADVIDTLALKGFASSCRPILIPKSSLPPKEYRERNRSKIRFRGLQLTFATARCNRPRNLVQAL